MAHTHLYYYLIGTNFDISNLPPNTKRSGYVQLIVQMATYNCEQAGWIEEDNLDLERAIVPAEVQVQ